jgi:hypothetical protein
VVFSLYARHSASPTQGSSQRSISTSRGRAQRAKSGLNRSRIRGAAGAVSGSTWCHQV